MFQALLRARTKARKKAIQAYRKLEIENYLHRKIKKLRRDLPDFPMPDCRVRVVFDNTIGPRSDMEFRRVGGDIQISMHWLVGWGNDRDKWGHAAPMLFMFANCGPETGPMIASISDGDVPSNAAFAYSGYKSDLTLLPDTHFFENRAYTHAGKIFKQENARWSERSDEIVWRGSPNGNGYETYEKTMARHPAVVQRIRLAQLAKGSDIDVKFVMNSIGADLRAHVEKAGLIGDMIEEDSWVKRKYAIDIDGYSNSWSNMFIRLKLGCCVLKVGSDFGYRQWYYERLRPFEHFVPVKADLSDLFAQVDWVRNNQKQAEGIAMAGRQLADSMTFESEMQEAARRITTRLAGI